MFQSASTDRLSVTTVLAYAAAGTIFYGSWKLVKRMSRPYFSPSRHIRSLPKSSIILGNISDLQKLVDSSVHEEWVRDYGTVFRVKLFLNVSLTVEIVGCLLL